MKKLSLIKILTIIIIVFTFSIAQASAAVSPELQNESANNLVKLNIMTGYGDGSLGLQNKIKRSEFFTLVVRMMGYDKDTDVSSTKITFKDLDKNHWAYNYIRLAVKYKLATGYPDNTIAPDNYVTYAEALIVLVRVLGYEKTLSGKWPDNVLDRSSQLGLNNNVDLASNKQITRGEISVLVNNSLTVDFNN